MKPEFVWKFGRSAGGHSCNEDGCCVIPETRCPSRCAGEIKWSFGRGAVPEASVLVRNVGSVARNFAFSATALAGIGAGAARLEITPTTANLQPGQSTVVSLKLMDSLSLRACQGYHAELLIEGSWQQCVSVVCKVLRDPFDEVAVCQGNSLLDRALHSPACKSAIGWTIDRGVTPEAVITVHNTGSAAHNFKLDATPLVGPSGTTANLLLAPNALQLEPGAHGVVRVKLENSGTSSPGQNYHGDVVVRGFYDQRLRVHCCVEPDAADFCEVEQGEAPTRRRAHHFYDHFQCTDRCVPDPA